MDRRYSFSPREVIGVIPLNGPQAWRVSRSAAYLGVGSCVTQHPKTTSRTSSPTRQPVRIGPKEADMIIPTSSRITRLPLLLPLAFAVALPLEAADGQRGNNNTAVTVLYEGPLLHEE